MKATGVVRKVDQLGRIVLPIELRGVLETPPGTPLEIFTEGGMIILKKYQPGCVFCGNICQGTFKGQNICPDCRNDLRR